jgi:NTP pyrophosphatase (non-canonical NTP hydrolase)
MDEREPSKRDKLDLEAVVRRAREIRARYHELEVQHHGSEWTVEEDALAFLSDAGLVGRLTMDRRGRWPKAGSSGELEHKLGECVWWLAVLADRLDVDIEQAVETFLSATERRVQRGK